MQRDETSQPIISSAMATFGSMDNTFPPPLYREKFDNFGNKKFSIYFNEIYLLASYFN